jgi:hypothetical protein
MKIRFGLHFDGQRGWQPRNAIGEATVGPLGLLDILETQVGLSAIRSSQSERIVQYRDCLRQCDEPSRFYHRTFETDELGTSATLLAWRDSWHLHGWEGRVQPSAPARIQDIAVVERLAAGHVAPSIGERLALVIDALLNRKVAIEEILLFDPLGAFPKRWRDVLSLLPIRVSDCAEAKVVGSGFLGQLQEALHNARAGKIPAKLTWRSDGTVSVVQAETRFMAGRWLADHIGQVGLNTLLVAPQDGERLDGILVAADRPRQGLRESSAFRPALQVLPLALEILWEPLNFYGLLQFLTHSICPVPAYARYKLAGKLAERPGIGGASWELMLDEIDEHYGDVGTEAALAARKKIAFWVEHRRYDEAKGADIDSVIDRVEALSDYFRGRLADTDRTARIAFNSGFSQSRAAADALKILKKQGSTTIRPRQLQTLIAQATARGSDNPLHVAEVGASLSVTHPGAAIEPCERVLWWQLGMPSLPGQYPWSQLEMAELARDGAELPDVSSLLDFAADEWLRPIMAARSELVLVLPSRGEDVHPVWQMIEALVDHVPIATLEETLIRPSAGTMPVSHQPLPRKKRFWCLPKNVPVAMRDKDSFSSLEKQVFNPYHWLLQYPAKLKASRILSVAGDFLLFGNFAHDLVEAFFLRADALVANDADFDQWFETNFNRLVVEEAAVLLMPGRRSDLEGFRIKLKQSFVELRQQLAKAKVTKVDPEMPLDGIYPGGELTGFADLVLEKGDGSRAVIDMKWSGVKKYSEKLRENRHLQLAIYAELLRQKFNYWPSVGYFILDRGRLFTTEPDCFPSAEVVHKTSDENTAQLWQRFIETLKWRRAQFNKGMIEVALDGIPETEDSIPPDNALAMEYLNPAYNDYLALAGWEGE